MIQQGLTSMTTPTVKPQAYGKYWETNACDAAWYEEIFRVRTKAHDRFVHWFSEMIRQGEDIASVIEVGCGRAPFYPRLFAEHGYKGIDISAEAIKWCQKTYPDRVDDFLNIDVIQNPPLLKSDFVFSHAVIDHVYDIDGFLSALAGMSNKWVYVSAYFGWFPQAEEHVSSWHERDTCYYNQISVKATRRTLEKMGCKDIQIFPVLVENTVDNLPLETAIVFRP